MKRISIRLQESEWRPIRDIHLVRNKLSPHDFDWTGMTDDDCGRAYAVLGTRNPDVTSDRMRRYWSSIAREKGYTVYFHEE